MKPIIVLLFTIAACFSYGQTSFKHKVFVRTAIAPTQKMIDSKEKQYMKYEIFKLSTVSVSDTFNLDSNSTLIEKRSANFKDTDHEMEKKTLHQNGKSIVYTKKKTKAIPFYANGRSHKANLHVSKDTIYINFWLCKDYYSNSPEQQKSCFYQPNDKYFILLKNRQVVSFTYTNWEVSTLLIPFKYQFGFKKNNVDVPSDIKTDLNVNAFLGYRIGKVNYFCDQYKGIVESKWSYTIGGFLGLNSMKIDSTTSSLSSSPLTSERNVPSLSYGGGIVFNIKDFNVGAFLGADAGLNNTALKWNYHNKLWLGFGLGYKLGFLGKSE